MKKEYIYAGISIFLWSTTATVTKLLLGSLNSMQILAVSSFFAFIFLLILNLFKKKLNEIKKYKIKDYLQIAGMGALGVFLYYLFLYLGTNKMLASQAFILNYLWPMMTVVFACIILKEKMTLRKILAIVLSFVGVIIVTANGNLLNIDNNTLIGALFCILAAISYGLFSVLNKYKGYDKYASMMLYYLTTFIICIIYLLITRTTIDIGIGQAGGLIWSGIATSAIAFTTWALALQKGDTAKISNLAYITPFLSLVWTYFFLKENISIYSVLGLVVIVLGIFIQLKEKKVEKNS
ncbi:MAG: DMT family transporter [Clostridia bacterium]|nr:DMT family transporter [Clostridia bacterium]